MPNERPTEAEIRDRAYQLYMERGGISSSNDPLEDWLRAEQELLGAPTPITTKAKAKNGTAAVVAPPAPPLDVTMAAAPGPAAAPPAAKKSKRAAK